MTIRREDFVAAKTEISDLLLGGLLPTGGSTLAAFGAVTVATLSAPTLRGHAADALPNIHAIGVGRKLVMGAATADLAIRIYVQRKLPRGRLATGEQLPTTIAGLPTDVIESAPARILPVGDASVAASGTPCSLDRRQRQRPAPGGVSVGHGNVTAGTLGFVAHPTDPQAAGDTLVVSNNHVFADLNRATIGDALLQPGTADGGTPQDRFAGLLRFHPLALGAAATNRVDAAVGLVDPGTAIPDWICSIGSPTGVAAATEDQQVCKHGRTTAYTEGIVADAAYDTIVGMSHSDPTLVARFVDQIRVQTLAPHPAFALGGDSGSALVERDSRRLVGLYFAGPADGTYGLANPIAAVLSCLKIQL